MSPTRTIAILIASTLLMLPACKKKNGDEASERSQEQAVQVLEKLIPGDVEGAVLIRDFSDALSGVGPLLDRAEAYVGDLSPIEADLRNTLGVDIRHPEQLASIGIDPNGQAIITRRSNDTVIAVRINDSEKFEAHVTEVLQGAPFSLRAPVTDESQADARVLQFRRSEGEAAQASLIVRDSSGLILLGSGSEPPRLEDYLSEIDRSLADNEQFAATVRSLDDYPVVVWGDPKSAYSRRPSNLSIDVAEDQLESVVEAANAGGLGLDAKGDRLRGEFALAFESGEELEELKSIYVRGDEAPTFSNVATQDAYMIARMALDPSLYMRTAFERLAGVDSSLDENARTTALNQVVERDFDATVVPAFGTHLFLATTRARVITLSTAMSRGSTKKVGDFTDSFGLVLSLELRERAPVIFAIDKLIEKEHLAGSKREEDGVIIYDLSDSGSELGALIVQEDKMTFVPRRQARELTAQLLANEAVTLDQFHTDEARTLAERTDDAGIALDVDEILNGPFGNLMGNAVPDQLRSTFNLVDEAWIRWTFQQDTLRAPFQIILNDAPSR